MKTEHNSSTYAAFTISPLDGRYQHETKPLRNYFSEFALVKMRFKMECEYLLFLLQNGPIEIKKEIENKQININSLRDFLNKKISSFHSEDFKAIKNIERQTKHDVKAVEIYLSDLIESSIFKENKLKHLIHFALTSEDINNLSYTLLLKNYILEVYLPLLKEHLSFYKEWIETYKETPFPARTHGQLASPTTLGKEMSVFASRLLCYYLKIRDLTQTELKGKLNGATGNYSAHHYAFPDFDWILFSQKFIEQYELKQNLVTTQIEDHHSLADLLNLMRQVNNILIDLDSDFWMYLSYNLFSKEQTENEVGSSTMPHKANPIKFEKSEGNLLLSNSMLAFFSDKLCHSRMQRDLTDSTLNRNIGSALAYAYIGIKESLLGLTELTFNPLLAKESIEEHTELLSEGHQTLLRKNSFLSKELESEIDPFEFIKNLTRNKFTQKISNDEYFDQVEKKIISKEDKEIMRINTSEYLGHAKSLSELTINNLSNLI